MKNGFDARGMLLICALAGCVTGVGIDAFLKNIVQPNEISKDNTLLREEYDGVFFDKEITITPTASVVPTRAQEVTASPVPTETQAPVPTIEVRPTMASAVTKVPAMTMAPTNTQKAEPTPLPTIQIPSPTIQIPVPTSVIVPTQTPTPVTGLQTPTAAVPTQGTEQQVFTYPTEIFGQVPVVNRDDNTVTYFEFSMDLIETLEGEIQRENLNEVSLFTKFMLKAVFCGVEIQSLKINDAIPRRQAALALHLAAEVMEKAGTGTTARSAQNYVTDIGGCSSSERKAIAYVYEQGIQTGYKKAGQRFRPEQALTEAECAAWFSRIRELWR